MYMADVKCTVLESQEEGHSFLMFYHHISAQLALSCSVTKQVLGLLVCDDDNMGF